MIETTIVPIVKNKSGNLSDSSNYRPIALATIISKMFASVLLLKCAEYLSTSDNQFGFKSCHSSGVARGGICPRAPPGGGRQNPAKKILKI